MWCRLRIGLITTIAVFGIEYFNIPELLKMIEGFRHCMVMVVKPWDSVALL
jgi:hypothetical protein